VGKEARKDSFPRATLSGKSETRSNTGKGKKQKEKQRLKHGEDPSQGKPRLTKLNRRDPAKTYKGEKKRRMEKQSERGELTGTSRQGSNFDSELETKCRTQIKNPQGIPGKQERNKGKEKKRPEEETSTGKRIRSVYCNIQSDNMVQ